MNLGCVLSLPLFLCAAAGTLTSAPTVELTNSEREWLQAHPVVRWGVEPTWPPFSYRDKSGELVGIDAELTRLVAQRVGLRIVLVPTASWSETLARARAGEIDFLSGMAITRERMAEFDYTDEYASFPVVIITRKDGPFVTSIHGLGNARLAGPRDHVTSETVRHDFPAAHMILTDTSEQAMLMVSTGHADAAVMNLAVSAYLLKLRGLGNLKISGVTRYEFPFRFAVSKDAPLLASILNKGLNTLQPSEHEVIYAKYLHPDIAKAREWGVWRRRALYSMLIGAGVAGAFLFWNRTMAREIRRCKTVEAALELRTRELDHRVHEVERLNQELTLVNNDLDAFSSSVSHDLRSPLRRLTCFTALLQKQTMDRANSETQEYWSIIDRETTRMDRLIHDLLAFARVTRAEMRQQTVNMKQLVESTVKEFSLETQGRDVHWHIGALPEVIGDPNLLRQALVNLIENALKFTRHRPRTEIKVDVLPPRSDDKEAVFYVRDNGCGFDQQSAKSLFRPFQRLHTEAEYEGTGIGLVNVQRIIQKHGGRVWAEGAVGKGATFWFTLTYSTSRSR
jgi:signal transduction histidine kinase